jgi:predicted DNA-binding protein with PD1-like motif
MRVQSVERGSDRVFVLVFETGDEVLAGLADFARRTGITAAHFAGIGAFSGVTLGFFDPERKAYEEILLAEQVEALSVVGDLSRLDGEPRVHAHAVVGRSDGSTRGGHLVRARVRPTLEVFVTALPIELRRQADPQTGLALIHLPEGTRERSASDALGPTRIDE